MSNAHNGILPTLCSIVIALVSWRLAKPKCSWEKPHQRGCDHQQAKCTSDIWLFRAEGLLMATFSPGTAA